MKPVISPAVRNSPETGAETSMSRQHISISEPPWPISPPGAQSTEGRAHPEQVYIWSCVGSNISDQSLRSIYTCYSQLFVYFMIFTSRAKHKLVLRSDQPQHFSLWGLSERGVCLTCVVLCYKDAVGAGTWGFTVTLLYRAPITCFWGQFVKCFSWIYLKSVRRMGFHLECAYGSSICCRWGRMLIHSLMFCAVDFRCQRLSKVVLLLQVVLCGAYVKVLSLALVFTQKWWRPIKITCCVRTKGTWGAKTGFIIHLKKGKILWSKW